jgi:hypothetical protein
MSRALVNIAGQRFGSALAISPIGPMSKTARDFRWLFACACGVEFGASGSEARRGTMTGCANCTAEKAATLKRTHGATSTAEYRTWGAMKSRCLNPSSTHYRHYGGRGIRVCDEWLNSFEAFLRDMGPRPTPTATIDRCDVDGNYEPSNCSWASRATQANNKRNNHRVTIGHDTKTVAEWARIAGITESGIRARIRRGSSGIDLLATPNRLSQRATTEGAGL